jgi:spore maturation protein CgeB
MPDGDPDSIDWFRQKGINYFYSPPAVFHGGCYIAEPDPNLKQDVVFVGSRGYHREWTYRKTLIDWLAETYGKQFTLYEHSSQMREHKLNTLYSSVKIAVGDTFCTGFSHPLYFSDRLFEAAGRNAFQIFPYIPGIERYFDIDKEIVCYEFNNFEQLRHKIDHYLAHDDEREAIRRAGHERVKREHTYKHRLQNVLDVVLNGKPSIY